MEGTPTARPSGSALTADRLGAAWPEVSGRLRRMLASRGVDRTLSEDIVQEVAVRALDKQVPFTDPADLYRWAATTARRLHIDHLRSDCRTTCDDALVGVADATDVEHTAERRVALGQVWRAIAVMRPRERDAILESLEDRTAHSSQALVRRHRARASLRKAVGGVLTAAMVARLRLRELTPAMKTAAATATLAPALAIGAGGLLPEAADAPPPRPHAAAAEDGPRARTGGDRPAATVGGAVTARPAAARPATRTRRAAPARPAPPAEPSGYDRTQVGPLVTERPAKDPGSVFCLENQQRPIWCVPPLEDNQPPGL